MPNFNMIIPRILLIDDELDNLRLLIAFLKNKGFSLIISQGGYEGLELAIETQPELILLDIRMPDLDGFSVYQKLLAYFENVPSLVIFLSAIDDIQYKEYALNLGAVDYLMKPINHRELLARIHTHLNRHRRYQETLNRLTNYEKQMGVECEKSKDKKIQIIIDYLLENLHTTPSLNHLAQLANTNRTSINVLFRENFGMSIFEWLTEQRLLRAAILLRNSSMTIQNIIDKVGYANPSALSHAFKRRFGYTPSEYRLLNHKKIDEI
jgi:YesN/AraC family two-component response regulator